MEQKFIILLMSHLSIYSFMDHAFGVLSKKLSPNPSSSLLSLEVLYFVLYIRFMIFFNVDI